MIKNIAVVGAGLGGLSFAKALQHKLHQTIKVTVFERSKELKPALGGSIGISGCASILKKLGLGDEYLKIRTPMKSIIQYGSGGKFIGNHDLSSVVNDELWIHEGQSMVGCSMRDKTQKLLVDSLLPDTLKLNKEVVDIQYENLCPKIKFVDGTEEKFDLVVGADGIRSTVRRLIFDSYEPVFSGYRILYAVAPAGNRANPTAVCQRFNEGASWISLSAGGSIPTNDIAAVAIKTKEYRPEQWNNPGTKDEMILEAKKWNINDPEILAIITNSTRVFEWGVFEHELMKTWISDKIVLLGDACHATTPFVGQGANQAIIDGYSLADKLIKLHNSEYKSLPDALLAYEKIRKPQTSTIVKMSSWIGAIETCSWPWSEIRDYMFKGDMFVNAMKSQIHPKY